MKNLYFAFCVACSLIEFPCYAQYGIITTVAGGYSSSGYSGDGGPATNATFMRTTGISVDSAGNLFIADWGNARIRKVDAATGIVHTLAGKYLLC